MIRAPEQWWVIASSTLEHFDSTSIFCKTMILFPDSQTSAWWHSWIEDNLNQRRLWRDHNLFVHASYSYWTLEITQEGPCIKSTDIPNLVYRAVIKCISDNFDRKALCLDVHAGPFTMSHRFKLSILSGENFKLWIFWHITSNRQLYHTRLHQIWVKTTLNLMKDPVKEIWHYMLILNVNEIRSRIKVN